MTQAVFEDLSALLDASMDDIADLPPTGVPPAGHYRLSVTASRERSDKSGSEYFKFSYEVLEVGELKNPEEAGEVAVGMKFSQMFSPFKKDGTPNEFGMGFLKEAVAPFAAHFGITRLGEALSQINQVQVSAVLTRRRDKKDEERWNFNLKDVVVL